MNGIKRLSKQQRHRSKLLSLSLGVLLALLNFGSFAEDDLYTWKDEAGRTHYSNRPPKDQPANKVDFNLMPGSIRIQPTEHIYTWIDDQGNVYYGAKPPPNVPSEELKEDDGTLSTIHQGQLRHGERHLLQKIPQN